MSFKKRLEFANYTCKFGEDLNFLDMFEEVVWPSFDDYRYIRKFKGTEFFFINTSLVNLGRGSNENLALIGKIVKNTKLKREQIYRSGTGIVEDKDELESAPTSIFVIMLSSHRLLYMKEVSGAPDINAFRSTSKNLLKKSHNEFIERKYKESLEQSTTRKTTKKDLVLKYPYPELRVTTLTDPTSLRQYVDHFSKIDELVIRLLPTNNEDINNDDFWKSLSEARERMSGKNVTTKFVNNKEGLDSEEVFEQSSSASELANSEVKLRGEDESGGELKGNNDDFRLTVPMENISKKVKPASESLYSEFINQVASENIKVPNVGKSIIEKVNAIAGKFL